MIKFIVLFIFIYLFVFVIYKFILRKYKYGSSKRKKLKNKYPMEVVLLKNTFKVEVNKNNVNKILNLVAVVSSFDIALIASVIGIIDIGLVQIVVAMIIIVPVIISSYYLLAKHLKSNS